MHEKMLMQLKIDPRLAGHIRHHLKPNIF